MVGPGVGSLAAACPAVDVAALGAEIWAAAYQAAGVVGLMIGDWAANFDAMVAGQMAAELAGKEY